MVGWGEIGRGRWVVGGRGCWPGLVCGAEVVCVLGFYVAGHLCMVSFCYYILILLKILCTEYRISSQNHNKHNSYHHRTQKNINNTSHVHYMLYYRIYYMQFYRKLFLVVIDFQYVVIFYFRAYNIFEASFFMLEGLL